MNIFKNLEINKKYHNYDKSIEGILINKTIVEPYQYDSFAQKYGYSMGRLCKGVWLINNNKYLINFYYEYSGGFTEIKS
jgi:hypothetical protein